jgi:chromosome partitioning protein
VNLAAALAIKARKTLLIDLDPQADSCISFLDQSTIERSTYDAIADQACGLARIIQPAATLQDLSIALRGSSSSKPRSEASGELDAHFRLEGPDRHAGK